MAHAKPVAAIAESTSGERHGVAPEAGAYERLRQAILSGFLAPGALYSQLDLTRRLGVSRTPLREAARRLQSEGLVEHQPNRRLRIAPLTPEDLSSLYAMRIALEPLAVRLTVPRMTSAEREAITENLAAIEAGCAVGDNEATRTPHREFHRLLCAHVGLRFVREVQELRDHADRYRQLVFAHGPLDLMSIAAGEHRAIAEAAVTGEADRCAELLAEHLGRAALWISSQMDRSHDPLDVRTSLRSARFGAAGP